MRADINKYIIRVYAIIINPDKEILISDEFQLNTLMTKFPGGGMNFGEGPLDCLKREAIEEFGQEIEILEHFYTTDFFQSTQFFNNAQLISIYYLAKFKDPIKFKISDKSFNFDEEKNGAQSFRWENIDRLDIKEFIFPIDKKVAELVKEKYK